MHFVTLPLGLRGENTSAQGDARRVSTGELQRVLTLSLFPS